MIKQKGQGGYVLISVLVVMMILVAMMYFFADALFSEMAISRNQKSATQAFHLAEAGVQEAVWRIQHDAATRTTFLTTTNGLTIFSHNPALLTGGSYDVSIQNTAKAAATVTATGYLQMGLKTAQRRISVKVTKAVTPPPFTYDSAILTGGATGEEDITFTAIELNITGSHWVDHDNNPLTPDIEEPWGSLISNRDIWFTFSDINVVKDILAKREIRNIFSDVTAGGVIDDHVSGPYTMPEIDVTSDDPDSYKSLAITQNQYYDDQTFKNMLKTGPLTFNGVVYVAGGSGIVIDNNQSLTVNGMLVAEGSVDVGKPTKKGTLTINHVGEEASGVIALNKFTAWAYSIVNIEGLVYVGDRFAVDPYYSLSSKDINIEGAVLCRRFGGNGLRTINIEFNQDYVNQALQPSPDETPIIVTQHWEEEY